MIAPQYGDSVRVNALVGGIFNMPEGVWLKSPGDEAEVVWSPFWQGELDLQRICLPVPFGDVLIAVAPEDWEPEVVVSLEADPGPDAGPEAKPKKRKAAEAEPMAEEPEEEAEE